MPNADKLTDRELAETWRYQKARDQLNSAWDGDAWEGLTKRQKTAFAKAQGGNSRKRSTIYLAFTEAWRTKKAARKTQ